MKNNSYALDNAAKIYPASMNKKWNAVFRVSVYLKKDVRPELLRRAAAELAARFPTLYTQLHKGFLWDSLVPVENYDIVVEDTYAPCRPMLVGRGDRPMFRVLYSRNVISAEFFHALTDGTGAMIYLKTLTARYLELSGCETAYGDGVPDWREAPEPRELSDDFQSVYQKGKRQSRAEENAYQYTARREENYLKVTSIDMPLGMLKSVARSSYDCTVTEYLAGVYAYAFLRHYCQSTDKKNLRRPVKISVPINLRPYFNSKTVRNFASFVNISLYPYEISNLYDAVSEVKRQMKDKIQLEKIQKTVSQNVAEEKMLISRLSPNFLKKLVMKLCFLNFGERKYTSPLSNLGLVKVPDSMRRHIERFEFVIGETPKNCIYCAAVGFNNSLTVTLSSVTRENVIENYFTDLLCRDKIAFEIRTREKTARARSAA